MWDHLNRGFDSLPVQVPTFLTLPMALVGGVLSAWLSGGMISLGSLVGSFTVFGIAARNGILLINHCQHLKSTRGWSSGRRLCCAARLPGEQGIPGDQASPDVWVSAAAFRPRGPAGTRRRPAGHGRASSFWRAGG